MNLWIVLTIVIESMACLGVLGVLERKSTRPAFLTGFNTMIFVTATYIWFSLRLDARAVIVMVMVIVYLIYIAFGMIGNCIWGWISPLLNFLQYIFDAIPKNEKWASERYGQDWGQYVKRTKSFIPYIY